MNIISIIGGIIRIRSPGKSNRKKLEEPNKTIHDKKSRTIIRRIRTRCRRRRKRTRMTSRSISIGISIRISIRIRIRVRIRSG